MRGLNFWTNSIFFVCLLLAGCNPNGKQGYVEWVQSQKPFEIAVGETIVRVKECLPEMALIHQRGKLLTKEDVAQFYSNQDNLEFIDLLVELDIPENYSKDKLKSLNGFETECYLDEELVHDVVMENSGLNESKIRYHVVCKKKKISPDSKLEFNNPILGDEPIYINLNDALIKNKKKLQL